MSENSIHVSQARDINGGLLQTSASPLRPEYFRLPSDGGDPWFGLSRTYYYEGEKRGYWRLVRLRDRGKLRGVTLIPYDAVSAHIRSQIKGKEASQ